MFNFFKKKKQGKVLIVPTDRMEEVIEAWHKYYSCSAIGKDRDMNKLKFWLLIESIFPEVALHDNWMVNTDRARYRIKEIV